MADFSTEFSPVLVFVVPASQSVSWHVCMDRVHSRQLAYTVVEGFIGVRGPRLDHCAVVLLAGEGIRRATRQQARVKC